VTLLSETPSSPPPCELCEPRSADALWQDTLCRIVLVQDAQYPGFCRVILNRHVADMTDLAPAERASFMEIVFAAEAVLRQLLAPDKINLASLGNMTPHLHWHIIPRYRDDAHFPQPIWSSPMRPGALRPVPDRAVLAARLRERLG
jgi:diadenosine tetraphosphate (Ap4A) HIT family hydrolase